MSHMFEHRNIINKKKENDDDFDYFSTETQYNIYDLSEWYLEKVTNMSHMFRDSILINVVIPKFEDNLKM